ncbi:hypothetical protein D3C73_1199520 [compost metagenome]
MSSSADAGFDPCCNFYQRKWLGYVIIGPKTEADGLVDIVIFGRHDQNRDQAVFTYDFYDFNTIEFRHHNIYCDQVVTILSEFGDSVLSIQCICNLKAFFC